LLPLVTPSNRHRVATRIPISKKRKPRLGNRYFGFVDMTGGSSDDATLGIAHVDRGRTILDLVVSQAGSPPFNPRQAVMKFANQLRAYGLRNVTGHNYAGLIFKQDFESFGISYTPCRVAKSVLYEELEPKFNSGEIELPDIPKLQEQALGLVVRGARIDHLPGGRGATDQASG
jgi:hypothetical protein